MNVIRECQNIKIGSYIFALFGRTWLWSVTSNYYNYCDLRVSVLNSNNVSIASKAPPSAVPFQFPLNKNTFDFTLKDFCVYFNINFLKTIQHQQPQIKHDSHRAGDVQTRCDAWSKNTKSVTLKNLWRLHFSFLL